ncbi:MAG TPA: cysteine peptidase family C39 domain-containing protein [Polyangia bacterium]|nr:cysteine peptidase family C39 domain-containing protein [Polyangia bacterium]
MPGNNEALRRAGSPLVAFTVLLSATAVAGQAAREPARAKLLPVPLISQAHPWSCGAAALMAALVYFGVFDEAESKLDEELGVDPEQGTRVTSIVAEARHFGVAAEARTGMTLDDLGRELARGSVVIVAIQAWPAVKIRDWRASWEDGHYVVVVGLSRDRVFVMDPSVRTGYAYLRRNDFIARWHDYDLAGGHKVVWDQLGIVIRGTTPLRRYPAAPAPVE